MNPIARGSDNLPPANDSSAIEGGTEHVPMQAHLAAHHPSIQIRSWGFNGHLIFHSVPHQELEPNGVVSAAIRFRCTLHLAQTSNLQRSNNPAANCRTRAFQPQKTRLWMFVRLLHVVFGRHSSLMGEFKDTRFCRGR